MSDHIAPHVSDRLQEYALSICLHNEEALAHIMTRLDGDRDFTGRWREAFKMIEKRYHEGKKIDPITTPELWADKGIFEDIEAGQVAIAHEDDYDYEEKVEELRNMGVARKADKDIEKMQSMNDRGEDPQKIADFAFQCAMNWNQGGGKKYYSAREIDERPDKKGEKLVTGVPLLDNQFFANAGLNKGTMLSILGREKHGKTRSKVFINSLLLLQGYRILDLALENTEEETNSIYKETLQDKYDSVKDNLFIRDAVTQMDEIKSTIIEALFVDGIDSVSIDYVQEMNYNAGRYIGENENINLCVRGLRQLMIRFNFHCIAFSQLDKGKGRGKSGWDWEPRKNDPYGSNEIIKASSAICGLFRPNMVEDLLIERSNGIRIKGPQFDKQKRNGENPSTYPYNSVFIKLLASRKKPEALHHYLHLVDSDYGLQIATKDPVY